MWNRIAEIWCKSVHTEAMWPIHGKYVCKRCLREYNVEWEGPSSANEYRNLPLDQPSVEIDAPVWLADH